MMSRCHCLQIGAMVIAVVLERDPQSGYAASRQPTKTAELVVDVVVEHGLRQPGVDDGEPHPRLHPGSGTDSHALPGVTR